MSGCSGNNVIITVPPNNEIIKPGDKMDVKNIDNNSVRSEIVDTITSSLPDRNCDKKILISGDKMEEVNNHCKEAVTDSDDKREVINVNNDKKTETESDNKINRISNKGDSGSTEKVLKSGDKLLYQQEDDSVEDAIKELEETLETCNNFSTCDNNDKNDNGNDDDEDYFLIIDETNGDFIKEVDSFEAENSLSSSEKTVICDTPLLSNVTDYNNCDKSMSKNSAVGTPTLTNRKYSGRKFLTSTPYQESKNDCLKKNNDVALSNTNTDLYVTPARIVLEKWKPSCLSFRNNTKNTDHDDNIENISAITSRNDDSFIKTNTEDELDQRKRDCNVTNMKHNGFEEAFHNLYRTLFGDHIDDSTIENNDKIVNDENLSINLNKINNNKNISYTNKLELYRNNVREQHEKDNEKFEEIISEISASNMSNSNHLITISETFCKDLSTNDKNLSVITEVDEGESDTDKTIINENNLTVIKNDNKDREIITDNKNNDDLLENEVLHVPVINGSNSIIYFNNRELTRDEEDALLNDDDDVISLIGSDIGSADELTPRLNASNIDLTDENTIDNAKINDELSSVIVNNNNNNDVDYSLKQKLDNISSASLAIDNVQLPSDIPDSDQKSNSKLPDYIPLKSVTSEVKREDDPFVSSDPKENEDNNDPEWEHLKRLNNDKDRYKALRERWRSVSIPDPNLDLTRQSYRLRRLKESCKNNQVKNEAKYFIRSEDNNSYSRKRCRSPPDPYDFTTDEYGEPPSKRRKCTEIFEQKIDDLLKRLEFKRYCLHCEEQEELAALDMKQRREYENFIISLSYNKNRNVQMYQLSMYEQTQIQAVAKLQRKYNEKRVAAEAETNQYVAALKAATEEVNTFHKFYQDLDSENPSATSSMYLNPKQIQELDETEYMIDLYSKFYN